MRHHPVYIAICALACLFLFYTNQRGFSLLAATLAARPNGAGAHASGFYHK